MKRRQYDGIFKARIVLEALRERKTIAELASHYKVHPAVIAKGKKHAVGSLPELFSDKRDRDRQDQQALQEELYRQIGQLTVELDWLKKNPACFPLERKRELIERDHPRIPLARQCELLGLARSSLYYQPRGESEENLAVMRRIDQLYTKWPFLGSRRMRVYLSRQGYEVNRKRVQRLMSLMGLEAIYPKRSLSRAVTGAKRYPYLLRGLEVASADEVWAADITYIRLVHGYLYLVAVLDWWSRYVLAWETSNTLDADFCVVALRRALERGQPEISNTDQGVQFSCGQFLGVLESEGDGRWTMCLWSGCGAL